METLILASRSPRRQELLARVGIPFEAHETQADEHCDLPADQAVEELSRRKAAASAAQFPGRYILAADTLVAVNRQSLGKPADPDDAARMLRLLSGRTHQVYTGITVVTPGGEMTTASDRSDVTFCEVPEAEIRAYVATGEPMDKAGAYAIQGKASLWISRMEGSPSSVMGLSLYLVRELLSKAGYYD